jgi:putative photosynthetic complex assembly protein 2
MSQYLLPALFTVLVWWFATGAILWLGRLPRWTFPVTMTGATLGLGFALAGLHISAAQTSVASAYCAFTCAVLVWGWQEIAFLLGYVTGARRSACPADSRGWRRAWHATEAILHHELALVVLALLVFAASWNQPNQTGWWAYLVLWTMRLSAKLNLFLGVRNLSENFLPDHLAYLQSYFTRRACNWLMPVSVTGATAVAVPLWTAVAVQPADGFAATSLCLVAGLLTLAVIEHLFMVAPIPTAWMWKWGMRAKA